jgi:hypothetical protein
VPFFVDFLFDFLWLLGLVWEVGFGCGSWVESAVLGCRRCEEVSKSALGINLVVQG